MTAAAALHPFLAFLERLALLVDGLGETIAGRREWDRLEQPLYASALMRLQRLFACVHRAVLAGLSGQPPRTVPFRAGASSGRARRRRVPPGEVPLPRGSGWLVRLAPGTQIYGLTLGELLSDPSLVALLANAPGARRSLRSLCVMLGTEPPAFIAPPVPPPSSDRGVAAKENGYGSPAGFPPAVPGGTLHPPPPPAGPEPPRRAVNLLVMRR